jgi:hypothetical protein
MGGAVGRSEIPVATPRRIGNHNLPQGFLGEVGEWCSPGGGVRPAGCLLHAANPPVLPLSARSLCGEGAGGRGPYAAIAAA